MGTAGVSSVNKEPFMRRFLSAVAVLMTLMGFTPAFAAQAIPAPSDVAAIPKDAELRPSGLASKVLQQGTGTTHPTATSSVTVHYTGWTTDGKMFDSSVARGEPIAFGLNQVIAGWTEGVQLMVVGEKRRLWIPQDLAYKGQPGMPAGMLVFDVELLAIN
jgi:peptidylprolyl isomerase